MRTLILSAGHSNNPSGDRGTFALGRHEGDLTIELRDLIVDKLKKLGVTPITDPNTNALRQSLAFFKQFFNPRNISVDIHFNAFNGVATGTEVLIPASATIFERNLATELSIGMSRVTGLRNRGVKTEKDSARGRLAWLNTSQEEVLLEICFMDNKQDMTLYQNNKLILAEKIAQILFNYTKL